MKKPDQPERRQYKRFKKHFILTYWDLGDPHVRHEATQLKNLSLGGICLVTAKSYAPMTTLCIELKTPFYSELTRLEAKVVQSNEKIKDVIASLNRSAKSFRFQLAREVELRAVPELRFYFDESTAHGFRVSDLIDAAIKKEKK